MFAETVNGLMAIPNLIALAALSPVLFGLIKQYENNFGTRRAKGGTYENFHQFQSLRTVSHEKVPSSGCGGRKEG